MLSVRSPHRLSSFSRKLFGKDTLCESCRTCIFNPTVFPTIFQGSDVDGSNGPLYVVDSAEVKQSASNGCPFCRLMPERVLAEDDHLLKLFGNRIELRVYTAPIVRNGGGEDNFDASKLFIDAGSLGCASYMILANAGESRRSPLLREPAHAGLRSPQDDPAGKYISTRPPDSTVDSTAAFEQARAWLMDCVNNHGLCGGKHADPSRLLRIQSRKPELRLETVGDTPCDYASLSYCWGAPQEQMLTSSNKTKYEDGMDIKALPQTIQDAIRVTRKLGLKYLWVDSLCIIQDDEDDKEAQVRQMDAIFNQSTVTIRVAGASRADAGFLQRKAETSTGRHRLPFFCPNGEIGEMLLERWTTSTDYDPAAEPANQRAWILQETLLPQRILTFPSAPHPLQWHCRERRACRGGQPLDLVGTSGDFNVSGLTALMLIPWRPPPDAWQLWTQVLQTYTARRLSNPEDKLRAMATVAELFRRAWGGGYLAGLWERYLVPGLLWKPHPEGITPMSSQTYDRWPSWSWASCPGRVVHPYLHPPVQTRDFQFLRWAETGPPSRSAFIAPYCTGWLEVSARMRRAMYIKSTRKLLDSATREEVGRAFMDPDVSEPYEAECMPIVDPNAYSEHHVTGLLLRWNYLPQQITYTRIGLFTLTDKRWFDSCSIHTIHIY